jgi:hypothetical protein
MSGVAALALAGAVRAQAKEFRLGPLTGQLSAEFSRVLGVRVLPDGRLLIIDAGNRLLVADFTRDAVAQLGREGQGPGEYRRLATMAPIGPDSTLVVDGGNGRWLVLAADRILQTLPSDHPATKAARGVVRAADRSGHLLVIGPPRFATETKRLGKGDSAVATLVAFGSASVDTVASLRTAPLIVLTELDAAGKVTRAELTRPPWSVGEEPLLFPDGWLAVARLEPYRVDWRMPSGAWVRGDPLQSAEPLADHRERQAFLDRIANATGKPAPTPAPDTWPATIPPFQPGPLVGAPDGSLLVLRTPTADRPGHRYDRIDRRGRLVGWLELAGSDRLAAVTGRHAYVVTTNDDGIQHVVRYTWP